MKIILSIYTFVLCVSGIYAQTLSPEKVAIYVTGGEEQGLNEFIGAYLVDAITHNSKYSAVERTVEFLKVIDSEQEFQHSGMVDDEQIAKLGKQFGTKLVCVVKIGKLGDKQFVQARLLDVETATVLNSTKPYIYSLEDLENICNSVAIQLLTKNKDSRSIQGAFGQ